MPSDDAEGDGPDGSLLPGFGAASDAESDAVSPEYREPDPEEGLPDPERDLPSVPEPPEPSTDEMDAPEGLLKGFWTTVAVFNVAVLAVSVGAMMVAFGVRPTLGLALLVLGLASLYRGYRKYRSLSARRSTGEW